MKQNTIMMFINMFVFGMNILLTASGKSSAFSECLAWAIAAFWCFMYLYEVRCQLEDEE